MNTKPILCGLLALAAAVGCKEEIPFEPELTVNRTAAEIGADGGNLIVEITSNTAWSAEADKTWVTAVTPSQGKASEEPVTVTVSIDANTDTESRTAIVTFTAGEVTKKTEITQAGKTETSGGGEATGSDSDLFVAWAFSSDMKTINEKTWKQGSNDKQEGFSDKHLSATIGTGDIQYYQVNKANFDTDKIYRHTGKTGEPMAYGSWEGDYFLFKATHSLSANSNVGISFGIQGKTGTPKYWYLEYRDGDEWKPAIEPETLGEIRYNVVCTKDDPAAINAKVVLENETDEVQFRLTCASKIAIDNTEKNGPVDNTYIRIDPSSIIIKGGEITDADIAEIVAPEMVLDKAELAAEATGASEVVALTSNIEWTAAVAYTEASDAASWVSVLPPSGSASETAADVTVTIQENSSTALRTATVNFTGKYGNVEIVKTLAISQTGKEPEPVVGTDSDLFVAWTFSNDLNALHKQTFHQNETNDPAAGDGGKYLAPALGTGKISYVQIDKTSISGSKIYRHIHKDNYPMVYGCWEGDYFLFEAEAANALPANSNAGISFYTWASNNEQLKYWMLEYLDGNTWKPALTQITENGVAHNVAIKKDKETQNVKALVVLENSTSKVSFRLRCVSTEKINGAQATEAPSSAIRIDSDYPVIIKGGAIEENEGVIKPALALDKTEAKTESAENEVALAVTSNMSWTASSDADWVAVSPAAGQASETASSIKVMVLENNLTESRTAIVTVTGTYGNHSISKTLSITQAGQQEEESPNKLSVSWKWGADYKDARQAGWHQDESLTDLQAGDGGKYIDATVGTGRLTFVQLDKSAYPKATIRRHLGKSAEPVVYGAWENDYFLFEASDGQTYQAGTKVSISFATKANSSGVKTWKLEYLDGEEWKTTDQTDISFATSSGTVQTTVTTVNSNTKFQFRLVCIGKTSVGNSEMTGPAGNHRIDSSVPLEIKVVE